MYTCRKVNKNLVTSRRREFGDRSVYALCIPRVWG